MSPLPHGALVDSVQGIYDQRTRGYRIQLRDASDMFDSSPPSFADAYFITPDTIRCIFDRNLTQASANNVLNYTVTSTLGPPDAAFRQVSEQRRAPQGHDRAVGGRSARITANGLVNAANGQAMTSAQAQTMFEGIARSRQVQAPDPAALAGSPCDDRSKFAGAGSTTGDRITMRGVCITNYGSTYFLEDAAGGVRSGITVFAPIGALVAGHQYVMAGGIQEFFTETEFVGNVYLKDEGVVAIPAAAVQTVHVLRDTTCDLAQALSTSEDYEGMLVKVVDVKTTEERTAGQSFGVAGPYPGQPRHDPDRQQHHPHVRPHQGPVRHGDRRDGSGVERVRRRPVAHPAAQRCRHRGEPHAERRSQPAVGSELRRSPPSPARQAQGHVQPCLSVTT